MVQNEVLFAKTENQQEKIPWKSRNGKELFETLLEVPIGSQPCKGGVLRCGLWVHPWPREEGPLETLAQGGQQGGRERAEVSWGSRFRGCLGVGQKIVGQVELPQQPNQAKTQNWSVGYAWLIANAQVGWRICTHLPIIPRSLWGSSGAVWLTVISVTTALPPSLLGLL